MKIVYTIALVLIAIGSHAQWTQVTTPTGNEFNDVCFVSNNKGFLITSDSVFITSNGGVSWNSKRVIPNSFSGAAWGSNLNRCVFTDSLHGFACAQNGFAYATIDGGQTWLNRSTPDTPSAFVYPSWASLNGIWFNDTNNGWIVGDSGYIWKTTNAGVTWTRQTSGTTQNLFCVHFLDANNGWAGGANKTVLKTTNGGSTWTVITVSSVYVGSIHTIYPVNATTIYFADGAGYMGKSTDGSTFGTISSIGLFGVNDMWCLDANTGYVVGQAGNVYATTNGGTSWSAVSLPGVGFNRLTGISRAGTTTWVCGDYGNLYKTTSSIGVKEVTSSDNAVSIFPNPSNGNFTVHFPATTVATITITDMTGKEVYAIVLPAGLQDHALELNTVPGIYFCTIQSGAATQTRKIVITE
jgi:photosystem II stability/assembly factor-like uncharacterized protein